VRKVRVLVYGLYMESVKLEDIVIHSLATITPQMTDIQYDALKEDLQINGQLEPITLYKGKVVDGRHRVQAMTELKMDTINTTALPESMTIADVRQVVLSKEKRRHQTPTQLAIMAYSEYLRQRSKGGKVSQGELAKVFGTNRMMMSRVSKLDKLVPQEIMELLFNGHKITISKDGKVFTTDSLNSLINYYERITEETISASMDNKTNTDATDDEHRVVEEVLDRLEVEYSGRILKMLSTNLYRRLNRRSNNE
jgi:hypothetical protein